MKRIFAIILVFFILLTGCSQPINSYKIGSSSISEISSEELTSSMVESSSQATSAASQSPSTSAPSEAVSSLSSAAASSSPAESAEWWKDALIGDALDKIYSCYVYRNSDMVSSYAWGFYGKSDAPMDFTLLMDSATVTENIGEPLSDISYFEVFLDDGSSYTGTFYEKGVAFSGTDNEEPVLLSVKEDDYQAFIVASKNCLDEYQLSAYLTQLKVDECSLITITSSDGNNENKLDSGDKEFDAAFDQLIGYTVIQNSVAYVPKNTELQNCAKVHLEFIDGIYYDLQYTNEALIITSSQIENAVQYKRHSSVLELLDYLAKGTIIYGGAKPVIYLYPKETTNVSVKLNFQGEFTYTYPTYNNGWKVTAYPDGRLINHTDNTEHYYLFWEGDYYANWSFDEGFVIKGTETEQFLQSALSTMGLTPREYNDFIVYWLPEMQNNAYNLITFAADEYNEIAPLEITPAPDSILRVHMVYKALSAPINIPEQELKPFVRKGFTVVEWGGSRAK